MKPIALLAGFCFLLLSCQSDHHNDNPIFPPGERIIINWKLLDDAVSGDDKYSTIFTIFNGSDTIFPNKGWSLFYNQLPTALYLPPDADNVVEINNINGDLYQISPLDSFPLIMPGEQYDIRFQSTYQLVKKSYAPHGLFFVVNSNNSERVVPVTNFNITPFAETHTFKRQGKSIPLSLPPETRYSINEGIKSVPTNQLSPIIPTPFYIDNKDYSYDILSNVKVRYEDGLFEEASFLAETLNQILRTPIQITQNASPDTASITLRQQSIQVNGKVNEAYHLNIDEGQGIEITGSDPAGVFYGIQSLMALIPASAWNIPGDKIPIPAIYIEDAPRFAYRGQHIDVARNFHNTETIRKLIRLMSHYKLNKLHIRLTDDEGWRLEIPGLPELTSVGARRGHSTPEETVLPPAYGSGGHIKGAGTGSGFFTREAFIQILQFATAHHIEVIPEICGPSHARAAVVAMAKRYDRYMEQGQESLARQYLLHDRNDQSRYVSAQNYSDNIMCVCQEYTYTFFEKVIGEIVTMYEEAGAPLRIIHSGGDEIPTGAWEKSPECERLINQESILQSTQDLHPYFLRRFDQIAQKFGLRTAGWEEIALKTEIKDGISKVVPNPDFVDRSFLPYTWNSIVGWGGEDVAYQLANSGYEVIMCNASNLYFDLAYNYEPEEPGLTWAGFVDTRNAFEMSPYNLFQTVFHDEEGNPVDGAGLAQSKEALRSDARDNLLGLQGQLWSETLTDPIMIDYYLLPKMLGLVERAWAKAPAWETLSNKTALRRSLDRHWNAFANRIGKYELPRLDYIHDGYFYRIAPPGAKIMNGKLYANHAFPGTQIRYTLDGTDPSPYSTLYVQPVIMEGKHVKLRAFNTRNRGSRLVQITLDPPK
jgi:hexosaminidase